MVLFSTIMFSPPLSVQAQTPGTPTPAPTGDHQLPPVEGKINPPAHPKMDSTLNRIVGDVAAGQSAVQSATSAPLHKAEAVLVTFYVVDGQHGDALLDYLEANGASVRNIGVDYLEAYVPVSLLVSASETPGVIRVQTIIPPQPAQQAAISEGVEAHGADTWHAAGITGHGIKIGVVDMGFDKFGDLMGTELPANVQVLCFSDVGVSSSSQSDCETEGDAHGTAVTEALYDIAPDATYFISNPLSRGDLKATVEWMIANDVDVINQSLLWVWDGPGDGTSPYSDSPLRTVDTAVESGATWVNAAGNYAMSTWFGRFSDGNGNQYHEFARGAECNLVAFDAGELAIIDLRWHDNWGGASRDLDLMVMPPTIEGEYYLENALSSEWKQSGRPEDIPFESVVFTVAQTSDYCIAVRHYSGDLPTWMQLQAVAGQFLKHHTVNGSIGNPAESANAGLLAVGATGVDNLDVIRPFSSRGPTPDGRIKPDVVGADGTYSAAYGERWFGTSLSSPHVAGLVALARQRFPDYSAEQAAEYIRKQAEAHATVPKPNNTWGYGFAKLLATDAVEPTPEPTESCWTEVEGDAIFYGAWDENCLSDKPAEDGGDRYAQFYTFGLAETANIIGTLESAEDAMLYLLEGDGKDGRVLHQNDDADNAAGLNLATDSRIAVELQPGDYTIEATTYAATTSGDFVLTVTLGVPVEPPPTPMPPPMPPPIPPVDTGYTFISSGADHVCALHSDGLVSCWGANDSGQASPPPTGTYIAISSGQSHTCALRSDGSVVCWGSLVVNP